MRIYLAGIVLIATLSAGCTVDPGPGGAGRTTASAKTSEPALPATALASRTQESFASLPDRGELLRYSAVRKVRRSGAYTSHPVDISEAHALNAIANGELRLNTPDGQPVSVAFDRIEEYPDGNWTWVGQNEDGGHAVLTFGERAVFGEIVAGGKSYRLQTRDGGAWLVETDPSRLANNPHGRHGDAPDFLLPPPAPAAAEDSGMVMAGAKASAIPSKAVAVVDVAVGYTNGLVSVYRSESAVNTRITNLVSLANAAYQRSGVTMRIRLVRTVKVNYADNTDNADTLEKLTGYRAQTGESFDPDPAFNDLRKARDDYGADLVALLRQHRSPEQKGCGIAWLLGAGQKEIVPAKDARYGYAVVSDGSDEDETDGHTYLCSDYSLAHEFGHSMGQAHNETDSEYAGTHAYSYGYRETASNGFYTIMAYPLANSSQGEIPYFANPSIKWSGRATGVANKSDNARSLNQAMPIVAQFRATVVPLSGVPSDFDGDGKSDILWRNFSSGRNKYWSAANASKDKELALVDNMKWFVAGVGDFSGDGKADILWRNKSNDGVVLWQDGIRDKRVELKDVSYSKWVVAGIGDFNGDGKDDILWRSKTTGENVYWSAANSSARVVLYTLESQSWTVVGIGDFNGDGKGDILWRNSSNGKNVYWNGGVRSQRVELETQPDMSWKVVGVGDFNGDGKADILWRNAGKQRNRYWSAGVRSAAVELATTGSAWSVAQIGDFEGDGFSDILWHKTNGDNVYWSAGKQANRKVLKSVPDTNWRIAP